MNIEWKCSLYAFMEKKRRIKELPWPAKEDTSTKNNCPRYPDAVYFSEWRLNIIRTSLRSLESVNFSSFQSWKDTFLL